MERALLLSSPLLDRVSMCGCAVVSASLLGRAEVSTSLLGLMPYTARAISRLGLRSVRNQQSSGNLDHSVLLPQHGLCKLFDKGLGLALPMIWRFVELGVGSPECGNWKTCSWVGTENPFEVRKLKSHDLQIKPRQG